MNNGSVAIPLSPQPAVLAQHTALGIFLRRWLARALSAALLAACAVVPDANADGSALEVRPEGQALRVQFDAERNRLWMLRDDGVYLYDLATRRQIGPIALPEWIVLSEPFNCAPALALDASGAAIVSSNVRAMLWRIDPERFEVSRQELALDTDRDKDVGFTGLTFVDGLLFGIDAMHGSLWKIDLAAAKAEKLALSSPVRGACSLAHSQLSARTAPDRPLILCTSGAKGTRRIDLSPDLRRGNVTEGSCP